MRLLKIIMFAVLVTVPSTVFAESAKDLFDQGISRSRQGGGMYEQGLYQDAATTFEEAADLFLRAQLMTDDPGLKEAAGKNASINMDNADKARKLIQSAKAEVVFRQAEKANSQGMAMLETERFDEALIHFQEAGELFRKAARIYPSGNNRQVCLDNAVIADDNAELAKEGIERAKERQEMFGANRIFDQAEEQAEQARKAVDADQPERAIDYFAKSAELFDQAAEAYPAQTGAEVARENAEIMRNAEATVWRNMAGELCVRAQEQAHAGTGDVARELLNESLVCFANSVRGLTRDEDKAQVLLDAVTCRREVNNILEDNPAIAHCCPELFRGIAENRNVSPAG